MTNDPNASVSFEHGASFEGGETSGNLRLGKLEAMYEELFADVIEDGVITLEERAQLDKMADQLGLDRMRLYKLEQALQAAYEARPGNRCDLTSMKDDSNESHAIALSFQGARHLRRPCRRGRGRRAGYGPPAGGIGRRR